jgi:tetratricopeptide (TPR) repeat protein
MFKNISRKQVILILTAFLCRYAAGVPAWDIPNEDDLALFGSYLEQSISNGNPWYFNHSFDESLDKYAGNEFNQGFIDGLLSNLDMGGLLVDEISKGGSFTLLHCITDENSATLIFRLTGPEGVNYHEYSVELIGDEMKVTDAYLYNTGQRISETVYALYQEYINPVKVKDVRLEKHLDALRRHESKGHPDRAYREWKKLPEGIRNDKILLAEGLRVASLAGEKEFLAVLSVFEENFPDEPAKYFIPLEGLTTHKQYDKAIANIDILDEYLHNDPLLEFFRANIYSETGEYEKATGCLYNLIKSMPELELGYTGLLNIYLEKQLYGEAISVLTEMIHTFDAAKEEITPFLTNYPDFIKSQEYLNWLKY